MNIDINYTMHIETLFYETMNIEMSLTADKHILDFLDTVQKKNIP